MSIKIFQLVKASRTTSDGSAEVVSFKPGVNVIVGEPNTGKSKWIETIDYILGEDKTSDEKLGEDLASKYVRAQVTLQIGEHKFSVERRWQEAGAKTKIFVDETAYDIPAFRQLLLDQLGIPSVHYPQGNPYGPRTWPELGWRSLFRHLYRRQRFWGDIADQQFPSEQHACILQFLGMAKTLFSDAYGQLVQKEKRITELQQTKERFLETLYEISKELVDEQELGTAITPDAIAAATARLEAEINELDGNRARIVSALINSTAQATATSGNSADIISHMSQEYAALKADERKHEDGLQNVKGRLEEVEAIDKQITLEIGRLERAKKAGVVLADLKATHCPVCDQVVEQDTDDDSSCYLCHQLMPKIGPIAGGPKELRRGLVRPCGKQNRER